MSLLITSSLFGSIEWYENAYKNWKEKAYNDLKNMLAREWSGMSDAAQRGVDFENAIYNTLKSGKENKINSSDFFKVFLEKCKGGEFQKVTKKFLTVDGKEYCIYSKLDVWFPDIIIDIKTTSKWDQYSEGKYLNSMQHIMYCYTSDIPNFLYMVALFDGETSKTIQIIKYLQYEAPTIPFLENMIVEKIKKMEQFFSVHQELNELFEHTYSKYNKG